MRIILAALVFGLLVESASAAPARAPTALDCSPPALQCPEIRIVGDPPSRTRKFTGYADPALVADPAAAGRVWMAYSYLEGKPARRADGRPAGVPNVSTHLARSDDGGATWRFAGVLWDSPLTDDPEGRSPPSYLGSETPSIVADRRDGATTWFSVRLSYFLEPASAYEPRYATGWTMRVARAVGAAPAALAVAPEAVLGVRTTAAAYDADVDLNTVDPALADCAMWNNPVVAFESLRLFLVAECLVFNGREVNLDRTRMVVLSTDAAGPTKRWRWRYDGVLADRALAQSLGGETLVSATVVRGSDGALLFIATPQTGRQVFGQGCVAMELASLVPPRVSRDASGAPVIRVQQTSRGDARSRTGACAYVPQSATGLVTVGADGSRALRSALRSTGLKP